MGKVGATGNRLKKINRYRLEVITGNPYGAEVYGERTERTSSTAFFQAVLSILRNYPLGVFFLC